ncbi:terminase gpA endonuclease subunit, partial [Desulfobotulus sp.]|uniref:terminase gpA endonuclease subunit n=1 Tax=Desulfobotulus sp. TaxID=1940337 RepID=UPI002A359E7C
MKQTDLFRPAPKKPITARAAHWMPESVRSTKDKLRLTVSFSAAERRIFRKPRPMPPSEWAEKHRVVTMSANPGPWRNSLTPYLAGIMDASASPFVREIYCQKCPQSGVTEAALTYVGYLADREPGPVLMTFADENTCSEVAKDRLAPMFRASSRLQRYRTGRVDDESNTRVNLTHMPIYLAWASSSARLANKPIRYAISDEVDKPGYQATAKQGEAAGLELIEKRMTTFPDRYKWWIFSSPTVPAGNIETRMAMADVVFDYHVTCPTCSRSHRMAFKNIKWDGGRTADPALLERDEKLTWYECPNCHAKWDTLARQDAVRLGGWRCRESGLSLHKTLETRRPLRIGFHLPAWVTPFISSGKTAAAWLRGMKSANAMQDFFNSHLAEPYTGLSERRVETLALLRDSRPARIVPGNGIIAGLTAGCDTQDDGFWYEIRAWGYGLDRESWQIRSGFVQSFEALEQILWQDKYRDAGGNEYMIAMAVIDAMGHRTAEIYDWCAKHRGLVVPFQGSARQQRPWRFSAIEHYPASAGKRANKPIPGGLQLLQANVNFYKDELARLWQIDPADPGAWHFHAETPDDWLAMLCHEYRDVHGQWICPSGAANHGHDCSVYALVATDVLDMRYWERPVEVDP